MSACNECSMPACNACKSKEIQSVLSMPAACNPKKEDSNEATTKRENNQLRFPASDFTSTPENY